MHNTHVSQFIPPSAIGKAGGTWTETLSTHLVSSERGAADGSFTLIVPILAPSNSTYRAGAKLKSVDLYYKIANAADDVTTLPAIKKQALPATAVAFAGAAVTVTLDSGHDTAAKCKAAGEHTVTVTLSTPVYIDNDEAFYLVMVVDAAANTAFSLFGARANFELRL